ncbi:MAG: dihydroorotate dehydrogenase [Actinobacteria bacterium]|jgi:dihydroorotate dehydrogenase (NAD+) catalytic subunit|nr:dihydroorotate dehydrogenase [Actinomycetota bacterium]NBP91143.1 dihydroorotate dehydrogenase [Actinomycetota bacterium]
MTSIRVVPKGGRGLPVEVNLDTQLGTLALPSPILTASGCAASGKELSQFVDLTTIGAVVTKSIMMLPRSGRATPRMAETPSGMLNSIGLQGPGVDDFLEHDVPWLASKGVRTIVSIAGNDVEEFGRLAARVRRAGDSVIALEVNISCPNVANRGLVFACQAHSAAEVISTVRRNVGGAFPIFAKLSPDVTDIVEIAQACVDAGATGLSLINTLLGMVINTETLKPALAGVTGGLSGPAIRPVAVRAVWQVHAALPKVPLIGMGGILTGEDAFEFILAGASAIAIGTANFHDPSALTRVQNELTQILAERGFSSLQDAIGFAHRKV